MGYGKDIYEKAQAELSRRRQRSFTEAKRRRERIHTELPRTAELEAQLVHTGAAAARAVLRGGDTKAALTKLKDENLAIQTELRSVLAEKGYKPDDLEEKYVCEKCRDKGYVDGIMCDCMKALLRSLAYQEVNSRSPLPLENSSFENFELRYYSDAPTQDGRIPKKQMTLIYDACRRYADDFKKNSPSILMSGGTGLGKTHLSLAIASKVIDKGFGVIYGSTPDFITMLERESFSRNGERSMHERLEECDLLILDDLGTEFSNSFTKSAIYNLINARLTREKPTIISTNLTLQQLSAAYSERLVSRLIGDNSFYLFMGDDIRIQRKRGF